MKKQIILSLIISIFLISLINAEIQFSQTKEDRGNGTIINRMVLTYSKDGFGIANDYVKANDPLETYLQYNIYVKTFNSNNPNTTVDYCNLKIQEWRKLEDNPVTVLEENYTNGDLDINKAQYFFKLFDGDQAIAQETCYFKNKEFHEILLPAEMQMVMPTNECKACQFYLWTKQSVDLTKANSIGDNIVSISDYIKKVVLINFEIILMLFWIALILLLFIGIGLIFISGYWLFLYLSRISK